MAKETVNQNVWFKDASESFTDIAHMLMDLDDKGLIPDDMRKAIQQHADNNLGTLPANIAAIASSLAAAVSGNVGLGKSETANVSWGMASLAEQIHGWNELASSFGTANPMRAATV